MLNSNNEIVVKENDLVEMILQGKDIHTVTMEKTQTIDKYNHFANLFMIDNTIEVDTPAVSSDKYSYKNVENWYMPDKYKTIDVYTYVMDKCRDGLKALDRVEEELAEFENRGLTPVLQYMIYLVDFMRENNIVWGVGRGSSVASYVLYLIGVHKINSIKYELDYKEFFR
jgi:DNA polymerase III alpha subunit